MTEKELRDNLNNLTSQIPDETHRSFLMAVSSGKENVIMKKKLSVGLVFAILISLVTIAFAATELAQTFSVNWSGEKPEGSDLPEEDPLTMTHLIRRMTSILYSVPEEVFAIVEGDDLSSRQTRGITRTLASLDEVQHPGIRLPKNIAKEKNFQVELSFGCLPEGEYKLISEESRDGFTLKQYSVEPDFLVCTGYNISYSDEENIWHSIRSQLSITQNQEFQFDQMDGEDHMVETVQIPGMDHAVFISRGIKTKLIATRTLEQPVILKSTPGGVEEATTTYPYELIEMNMFTLEECLSFFSQE